jgi:hypothetical protein
LFDVAAPFQSWLDLADLDYLDAIQVVVVQRENLRTVVRTGVIPNGAAFQA